MSDHKQQHGDDEYQFPGDEYMDAESSAQSEKTHAEKSTPTAAELDAATAHDSATTATQAKKAGIELKSRFAAIKNKRAIWIVVIAVVILIIFSLMRHNDKSKVVSPPVRQQPVVQQTNPRVTSQLDQLQQSEQASENTVAQLQSNLNQLQSSLQSEANSQTQTNQHIDALISQVQVLSNQLHDLKQVKKPLQKKWIPKPIVYHVKAIEPGRAWVVGSNGESDTITIGNKLTDYGTVEAINADSGMVLTSSGKVISYGQNDY